MATLRFIAYILTVGYGVLKKLIDCFETSMRLSGTYTDRLFTSVLPYTFIATVLIFFTTKDQNHDKYFFFWFLLFLTSLFWIIDSIILFFKRIKTLKVDNSIYFDNFQITPKDILQITPVTDTRYRWSFKTIEFTVLHQGTVATFTVMDKPMTLIEDIMGKKSKTLERLFTEFPELEDRLHV